jgi:hypothetical protein
LVAGESDTFVERLLKQIVGFRIEIESSKGSGSSTRTTRSNAGRKSSVHWASEVTNTPRRFQL